MLTFHARLLSHVTGLVAITADANYLSVWDVGKGGIVFGSRVLSSGAANGIYSFFGLPSPVSHVPILVVSLLPRFVLRD